MALNCIGMTGKGCTWGADSARSEGTPRSLHPPLRTRAYDLEGFREDILDFSELLPGAILRMCAAATGAHYHYEGESKRNCSMWII